MTASLLQRFIQGGGLSLVKLVAGLAKIKVLATLLGADGIGLLSLGLQFQSTAVGLVSMSLAVGVINLGRPLWVADDVRAAGAVLGTALVQVTINSLLFLAGFALLRGTLPGTLMRSFEANGIDQLWPLAMAAVIFSFATVLWEGLSFLVDRFDIYVRTNIVAALSDALLFAGGAWLFGLKGALMASLLGSLALLLAYTLFSVKSPAVRQILANLSVTRVWVKPLFSYSVLMLTTTAMGLACLFLARAHLTSVAGEVANGHLQVVTALAAYMIPFVMNGVWGHLHPAAAASGDTAPARVELRRTLVASMRLAVAGSVAVVIFAPILVQLVYTNAFLSAQQYIPPYLIGELIFIFVSVLGAYLLAVGRKRAYFGGYALYHVVLLAGVSLGAAKLGPWAYVLSHMGAAAIVGLLAVAYSVRSGLLDLLTLKMVAACVLAAAVCSALDYLGVEVRVVTIPIPVSWLLGPFVILFAIWPYLLGRLQSSWFRGLR
jgi:PST family polysaccharide transporter